MTLVTKEQLKKVVGLEKYGKLGDFLSTGIMSVLSLNRVNRLYESCKHLKGQGFLEALLNEIQLFYEIHADDLKRIPKTGPFITISNHPLGALDGILLIKILSKERPDFKVMANFLLNKIIPLQPYVLSVNPFEDYKEVASSISGIKNALSHLKKGHPLGMFPAGEVSQLNKRSREITDREWQIPAIKMLMSAQVPVVPVYFHGRNSPWFYSLAPLNAKLRTAMLPSEIFRQKGKTLRMRIGKPIFPKQLAEIKGIKEVSDFLRKKTYVLANVYDKKTSISACKEHFYKKPRKEKKIISSIPLELIKKDISEIYEKDLLFTSNNYEIFCTLASRIPNAFTEIARLREITYREVGEGTNEALDRDRFDEYYHHLFLWDKEAEKIVGAYRLGFGKEIFGRYGIKGFYLSGLFDFDSELHPFFIKSIEMGRSFLIKAYQQKPLPLFLLWRGIVHTTLRFPEYKYLVGGVSISHQFSDFSISVMIEFMKSHFYDPFVAQYVRPKNAYKVRLKESDKEFIFDESKADLNKFDKLIDEIEPGHLRLPVLIKKYIKQNARVIAFNVDPKFNDATDGLMYIRISDIPKETVKPVLEDFQLSLEKNPSSKI